jgi:toxin HigB-1
MPLFPFAIRGPQQPYAGISRLTYDVSRYILTFVIKTFRCAETERLYRERESGKRFRAFADVAYRKLFQLNNAEELRDLSTSPGNRLEKLTRDRKGQHSIRINDQWRICFVWNEGNAYNVEIVDYH